ncbi:hypothetical protein Pelo_19715 [Pelomyxa schiedti]|nr:hypothetical protein Pelo_19715 [Pelomyxa schiedti]
MAASTSIANAVNHFTGLVNDSCCSKVGGESNNVQEGNLVSENLPGGSNTNHGAEQVVNAENAAKSSMLSGSYSELLSLIAVANTITTQHVASGPFDISVVQQKVGRRSLLKILTS